jgi:TatA/E family protein of Tat protein translocase
VIGPLEVLIVIAILLVIFGARYLPQLGRSAGKGVRVGTEKGKELAAVAQEKTKDVDTKAIARQAGDHVREARDLRDVVKGTTSPTEQPTQAQTPQTAPAPAQQPVPSDSSDSESGGDSGATGG